MRCFIGLPLPQIYQQGLQDIIRFWEPRLASRLSWVRPGNWHLTLKFLGDVPDTAIAGLLRGLDEPLGGSFGFQARGGGFFPDRQRPRVLWVGVGQGIKKVRILAGEIDRRCMELGFAPERRVFSPHLTVARIRKSRNDTWPDVLTYLHNMAWPQIEVDRVVLWESRLTAEGPLYRNVAEYLLNPASGALSGTTSA